MDPFDSLGGHYGLQTASEVRSALRFEISDLNYLHIHVHIVYMVWTLLAASEATTASEVKTESAGEIGDPNLLYDQVSRYLY